MDYAHAARAWFIIWVFYDRNKRTELTGRRFRIRRYTYVEHLLRRAPSEVPNFFFSDCLLPWIADKWTINLETAVRRYTVRNTFDAFMRRKRKNHRCQQTYTFDAIGLPCVTRRAWFRFFSKLRNSNLFEFPRIVCTSCASVYR